MKNQMTFKKIGTIYSPFKERAGMPIQPVGSKESGKVVVDKEFQDGLKDLDGFSYIILIYHFDRSGEHELLVRPFMDERERGVFATRSPKRPNNIGISVVKLEKIEENILHVYGIDVLDKTPLIDIKPYIPQFEPQDDDIKTGWMKKSRKHVSTKKSDGRFL
ncbi:MAG: tRNA (N6-threonylcarbamoyladenosine(37)-N6)-methyltransferase TrmO [Candidatus Muiribacterium halophilum]|uniref:tRNA (N6-threonylcarbamoyladenosine(37)-N6)-methyltransferase TrmO n=1 Tax=Muiribacterium halophilum TaxID=2053465 RepID=A0A2N5ZC58_MUIH1|nr:MAG: tRNA (N6-threonylcarbamoyladenosine(37)-N6)-methyltransferase TrmO [Candidatus Muirbacterium halophilum]